MHDQNHIKFAKHMLIKASESLMTQVHHRNKNDWQTVIRSSNAVDTFRVNLHHSESHGKQKTVLITTGFKEVSWQVSNYSHSPPSQK